MRKIDDKNIEVTESIVRAVSIEFLKNRKRMIQDQIDRLQAEKDKLIQQIDEAKLLGVE